MRILIFNDCLLAQPAGIFLTAVAQ